MTRDVRLLNTPYRRGIGNKYYSSYGSDRDHDCHHYHPYKRIDRGYFWNEFKKTKTPTFDGELNKLEYVEAWLLGMNFFELHDYIENMKAIIVISNFKGKENI